MYSFERCFCFVTVEGISDAEVRARFNAVDTLQCSAVSRLRVELISGLASTLLASDSAVSRHAGAYLPWLWKLIYN